jgi:hypothetical protein
MRMSELIHKSQVARRHDQAISARNAPIEETELGHNGRISGSAVEHAACVGLSLSPRNSTTQTMPLHSPSRVLLALALAVPAFVRAQSTTTDTTTRPTPAPVVTPPAAPPLPSLIPAVAADTIEVLRGARSVDSVRLERDRLLSERRTADVRQGVLRDQAGTLRNEINEVRGAIRAADDRAKQARKDKRDADRSTAEYEKRQLERSRDLLEVRYDVRTAQAEELRMQRDYLDAAIRAADAELAIAERAAAVSPTDPSQRGAFTELTNRWVQAIRTREARARDLASKRFDTADIELELIRRIRAR